MATSESTMNKNEGTWFFIRFFNWVVGTSKTVFYWLFPDKFNFPENESGELMRRILEKKSYFDAISSGWVNLHLGYKFLVVLGVTLTGGLIGIALSAPVICVLFSLVIMVYIHLLLVAHEHHRRTLAKSIAEETITLNKNLKAQEEILTEAAKHACTAVDELDAQAMLMQENVEIIKEEANQIHKNNEEITIIIEEVRSATEDLLDKMGELDNKLEEHKEQIHSLDEALEEGIGKAEHSSTTVEQFGKTVDSVELSKNAYAEAVTQFGIFVKKQVEEKPNDRPQVSDRVRALHKELDDIDAILDELMENQARRVPRVFI